MSGLTDFLLQRIAEDEAVAREATSASWDLREPGRTIHGDQTEHLTVVADDEPIATFGYDDCCGCTDEGIDGSNARHIARHDPARVLAECEAKRRIVELHKDDAPGLCDELLALAQPYADHPDFREEWRV